MRYLGTLLMAVVALTAARAEPVNSPEGRQPPRVDLGHSGPYRTYACARACVRAKYGL